MSWTTSAASSFCCACRSPLCLSPPHNLYTSGWSRWQACSSVEIKETEAVWAGAHSLLQDRHQDARATYWFMLNSSSVPHGWQTVKYEPLLHTVTKTIRLSSDASSMSYLREGLTVVLSFLFQSTQTLVELLLHLLQLIHVPLAGFAYSLFSSITSSFISANYVPLVQPSVSIRCTLISLMWATPSHWEWQGVISLWLMKKMKGEKRV